MRYRSQSVAYWYFALAMALFGLQLAFGLLAATKYLGPDPLLNVLAFDVAKTIHTNLLVVWVLAGFMGAAYWVIPEESRTELYSVKLAYWQLGLWALMGVTAVIGYFFRYGTGTKLLEQPIPHKIVIVIVMLMFLYNMLMTVRKGSRFTTTEGVLLAGIGMSAILYLPALIDFDNYTVGTFYRWWTIHLWVEGVWEMIQGSLLAYLLIRLTGADREVMEKWLYVIVGLVFIAGVIGTAHHYYWIGVPHYWLPIGGFFSALEPVALVGMAIYAYSALRRSGLQHPNTLALHWTVGSAVFTMFGAGLLGLAHTWPAINKWTHGTLITPMHGHAAFYGAYVMIVLAMIAYALPTLTENRPAQENVRAPGGAAPPAETGHTLGYWAFWLQLAGMFGMTISFATAGIGQVYLERILGVGFLETQLKIQVHFLMLIGTGFIFTIGSALYIYDFFRTRPRFVLTEDPDAAYSDAPARPKGAAAA
jgi:nitric oxide reductase subunit B